MKKKSVRLFHHLYLNSSSSWGFDNSSGVILCEGNRVNEIDLYKKIKNYQLKSEKSRVWWERRLWEIGRKVTGCNR